MTELRSRYKVQEFARAFSFGGLLLDENFSFEVPTYQREYGWGEVQVEDLWVDLIDFWSSRDSDDDYLLGQVILSPKSQDSRTFYIVDGQQRFTTLFILMAAARDFSKETQDPITNTDNSNFQHVTQTMFYTAFGGQPAPRLLVTQGGRVAFSNLIAGEGWTPDSTDRSAQNIKDNYGFFRKAFTESFTGKPQDFFRFVNVILKNLIVIFIRLPSDEHALDFFERTNDRGLPLNQADLMKNLLFSKVEQSQYDGISELWSSAINRLRGVELTRLKSMDFALKALLAERTGESIPRKRVFREWRSRINEGLKPEEFLREINSVTTHIAEISSQNDANQVCVRTTGSRYLNSIQQWTITSAARSKTLVFRQVLADIVEARTILSTITRERSQDFERIISPWAKRIADLEVDDSPVPREAILQASHVALLDLTSQLESLEGNLKIMSYNKPSDRKRMKLVLALVSREMAREIGHDSADFPLSTFLSSRTYDIEHIEPRSSAASPKFTFEDSHLVDSIGNLTLWYKADNRSAQDAEPKEKVSLYSNSSALLTQALCPVDVLPGRDDLNNSWAKIGVSHENRLLDWGVRRIRNREAELAAWLKKYFRRMLTLD